MPLWASDTLQDFRFAVRLLRKQRGFAAAAVLTLALGIGATTAVFSIVEAVLLRPLPYRDPNRLVAIWDRGIHRDLTKLFGSYTDFDTLHRKATSFESVSAATWAAGASRVMTGRGPAQSVLAIPASAGFFETLGASAALGRTFTSQDEEAGCSVVLAHSFWTAKLGADPGIVGQRLTLDREACLVLGVMPPEFSFYPRQASMWRLLGPSFTPPRDQLIVGIFARLKPGVTVTQAQAEAAALHRALHQADGKEPDFEPDVNPLHGEFTFLAGRTLRTTLLVVFAAVALVLLIACLNLSNLLLGRLAERQRELAVRAALGSGRSRLVRQVLAEGLLLSVLGAAGGIAVAVTVVRYFNSINPIELTVGATVQVNLPVLLFTGFLAIASALTFCLLPAVHVSRVDVAGRLRSGNRGSIGGGLRARAAKAMIAVEMGVSLLLLTGAALLLASALRMGSADLGFDPSGIVQARVSLPMPKYAKEAQRVQIYQNLLDRMQASLGANAVAMGSKLPPYIGGNQQIEIQGPAAQAHGPYDVGADAISPGYFEVLKTRILRGRAFDARDRAGAEPTTIVNQALADEYFPHQNLLGRQVRLAGGQMPWLRIVGVAANLKHTELMNEMKWVETPILYRPLAQEPRQAVSIAVRTPGALASTGRELQRAIAGTDPGVPLSDPEILTADLSKTLEYPRFRAAVLSMFALGALLLSAIGLHGVLTQLVAQRTAEFGLRRAVGAQTRDIIGLVARQGGVPVLIGLACGVAASLAASRLLSGLLYGMQSTDPRLLTLASLILMFVAAAAIVLPAWRAARVDPMTALRSE